jgi:hypothetical protein
MERLRPKLETIIEALEQYAKDRGDDFSRLEMPGPLGETHKEKGSFHWLCGELEPGFKKMGKDRFWHYRKGICACRHWANDESNFYTQALPVCRHFPGLEKTEQKF